MVVYSWRTAQLQSEAHLQVYNPANGHSLGVVDVSTSQETGEAIEAASKAWETWKNTTAAHRASLLRKWRELMESNISDIQSIMTIESGKPLKEAAGEIQGGLASLDWFAGEAIRCCTPSPVCTAVLAW
jgi:succinate-semialdehyde dehydrogenase / glutarate-semialdehyde dehydrogenase